VNDERRVCEGILELVKKRVLARHPLHGGMLSRWVLRACPDTPTMSIAEEGWRLVVRYSPEFVQAHAQQLTGVILHELGHALFGHTRIDPNRFDDLNAWIVACEVTVNEFITEPLPGNPLLLAQFGLSPGEDSFTRYEKLHGRELPQLPTCGVVERARKAGKADPGGVRMRSLVAVARRGATDVDPKLLKVVEKSWGTTPGDASMDVDGDAPPRVDWRRALRAFVASQLERSASYARPPRRFPHLVGQVPASAYRGTRRRVQAVVDTSGSVSPEELAMIAAELRVLSRTADVWLTLCDVVIHTEGPFRGHLDHVVGRGGTDLRPPLERAHLANVRADLTIYFTDGCGPTGDRPATPVVWCITPGGWKPADWGYAIYLGDDTHAD
jgi:predicted metal-dependent peptidase